LCGRCVVKRPAYDSARAAFQYDDVSRDFILSFKHGGRTEHIDMFARQMCRAGQVLLTEADILMPVPLHPKRLIKRRYNQSTLLARSMAQQAGLEVDCDTLYRRRATASQGGKTATGRRRNVQGAFALREGTDLDGKHIVIIDDVMTTGATLEACAQTLKKGGARRVDALTLARVVKGAAIPT
ncbi:MAG: ComF family protein, partial [Maricaulaceae bacterium]